MLLALYSLPSAIDIWPSHIPRRHVSATAAASKQLGAGAPHPPPLGLQTLCHTPNVSAGTQGHMQLQRPFQKQPVTSNTPTASHRCPLCHPCHRSDAAAWGRVLAEGKADVGFMTVAHPDLLDGVQVFTCVTITAYTADTAVATV
jgi:hypothetical protein